MKTTFKASFAALAAAATMAGSNASAELTGDLKIFLDTSNPAPRATMQLIEPEGSDVGMKTSSSNFSPTASSNLAGR